MNMIFWFDVVYFFIWKHLPLQKEEATVNGRKRRSINNNKILLRLAAYMLVDLISIIITPPNKQDLF